MRTQLDLFGVVQLSAEGVPGVLLMLLASLIVAAYLWLMIVLVAFLAEVASGAAKAAHGAFKARMRG